MSSGTCGVGGWGGPLPGDPGNNSLLSATPAFGGIDVSWTYPTTNPQAVAYTHLYRGLTESFDSAILLRDVAGSFYYDKLDSAFRYYYWIRIVSVNGTVGDLIGPASAIAKPTIEAMIELLTGEIDSGMLAITLKNQLDQISILNANLLQETFDREGGETSLASAIQDALNGVAEAHTFILAETASRVDANSAIVEQINGVAATLGSDFAAVTEAMSIQIDALQNTVYAMWTVNVNVNGLVGGFGIINDGLTVEAGFDVDRFWIGRTSDDKRKPFIIDGGVVYIDEGAINYLTFTKLRDESGSFIVEDGKVKANYLDTINLTVHGDIQGGAFTGYAWPPTGTRGFYLGPSGLLLGNAADNSYFQVDANTGDVYAPEFSIVGGNATFSGNLSAASGTFSGALTAAAINAVDTINLQGHAVTIPLDGAWAPRSIPGGHTTLVSMPMDFGTAISTGDTFILVRSTISVSASAGYSGLAGLTLTRNGTALLSESVACSSGSGAASSNTIDIDWAISDSHGAGVNTYAVVANLPSSVGNTASVGAGTVICIGTKK